MLLQGTAIAWERFAQPEARIGNAMTYDDDEALTEYILRNYHSFATEAEGFALRVVYFEEKTAGSGERVAAKFREHLQGYWKSHHEEAVREALKMGKEYRCQVRDRILADFTGEITINRCPRCGRIVRTPFARQCFWCGHDWHTA